MRHQIEECYGHSWEINQLGDDTFSVICLDPDYSDDGTDCTTWPGDSLVSIWAGMSVRFADEGDNPDYIEGIYAK